MSLDWFLVRNMNRFICWNGFYSRCFWLGYGPHFPIIFWSWGQRLLGNKYLNMNRFSIMNMNRFAGRNRF